MALGAYNALRGAHKVVYAYRQLPMVACGTPASRHSCRAIGDHSLVERTYLAQAARQRREAVVREIEAEHERARA